MSKELTTVYLFYMKDSEKLYAHTMDKEYKRRFLTERNSKKFEVVKKKMDEMQLSSLLYYQQSKKLQEIPLDYGNGKYIILIGTEAEDTSMVHECYRIENFMEDLKNEIFRIKKYDVKEKYKKYFDYLLNISYYKKSDDKSKPELFSKINTFRLFTHMYRQTFD